MMTTQRQDGQNQMKTARWKIQSDWKQNNENYHQDIFALSCIPVVSNHPTILSLELTENETTESAKFCPGQVLQKFSKRDEVWKNRTRCQTRTRLQLQTLFVLFVTVDYLIQLLLLKKIKMDQFLQLLHFHAITLITKSVSLVGWNFKKFAPSAENQHN